MSAPKSTTPAVTGVGLTAQYSDRQHSALVAASAQYGRAA